ncbi:MAG: FKBP-type peptidyl-prolyl cis-trans isomerase [Opitutaceae bacterium]|jgi:FKBP-type peptidyl-prolyl cis-trans isomerase
MKPFIPIVFILIQLLVTGCTNNSPSPSNAQAASPSAPSVSPSDFFTKLKENKAVIQLPSGLCYQVIKPGSGAHPAPTDTVKVNYTGTLVDGTVFDHSTEPVEFSLDQVIPGWTEGLQLINKGGQIKLYIPANLAYGDQEQSGIPAGSTLIFDIELIDITPSAAR